ncbi:MarR family winged helix-turn-helix transcriptional regulator [Aureispira anguillae]|uniref:MarR family winged helix-turn-helix transcriptional regulator n=1 Tax=Aureispira anguillae TaxID=2864201 RepID=A0A915YEP4_9BACT|nr:MarR family winged helix-turn-helix transcriptional regulator [Aureispira anguillae]BDS11628.1 MarR family winged helix-turn-helix transcriptional regulator [Aureispira anguillae]
MKYKLLTELLPYLDQFEKKNKQKETNINDFLIWMNGAPKLEQQAPQKSLKSIPLQGGINAQICQLISLLHKYVRFYYRKGFKESYIQTTEDFGFLATLATVGDLRKNELIQKNTSEFTSGMEVIRRLERNELIETFLDENDKRARRVRITDKGRGAFLQALPILQKIGTIATGQLTDLEKQQLVDLLNKLNYFHNPIFHEEKEANLVNIIEDYVQ